MNVITLLIVGIGGGLGAISRFLIGYGAPKTGFAFPLDTLGVNIIGCLLMGIFFAAALHHAPLHPFRLFIAVGFLGGFTTFSSFSLDFFILGSEGKWGTALAYLIGTNLTAIGALILGIWITKKVLGH